MSRSSIVARVTAVSAVALLSSCTGDVDFSIPKTFHIVTTGGTAYPDVQAVDMSRDAPDAWKHRSKVKSIDLVGIDAEVAQVLQGAGTSGTLSVWLRPDGIADASQDVQIGHWTENLPSATPHTVTVLVDAAGLGIINSAMGGNGRFQVVALASTVADTDFTVHITLHLKLTYKVL